MNRLLREPLVHFFIGGALLFAWYDLVADEASYAPDRIVIDANRVTALATTFQRIWLRPPTSEELDSLVSDFVDEEVLYREGLALGLDRDDLVIRRRLRQKVEFLHSDLVGFAPPTETELGEFLASNRERFRTPALASFHQVYVNPEAKTSDATPYERANSMLAHLRSGSAVEGDPTLLPESMRSVSEREISSVFGEQFAADLVALGGEGWLGPFASSFGLHLVQIDERVEEHLPELAEIRAAVAREFEAERRAEQNARFLEELRARYDIEVRMPTDKSTALSTPTVSLGG